VGDNKSLWRRIRIVPGIFIILAMLGLVGGEIFSRVYFGLGDPPLSVSDPEIEYLFKPGTYHRFGLVIHYNQFSQRSREISRKKTDLNEFRALFMGDSVLNGGVLTDDRDLATTLVESRLAMQMQRPVFIANVSAGSWGPPNAAAYLEKFGDFDADAIVLVFPSGDGYDARTFQAVVGSASFPDRKPSSAMWEGLTRYTPLSKWVGSAVGPDFRLPAGAVQHDLTIEQQAEDVTRGITSISNHAKARGIPLLLVVWHFVTEINGPLNPSLPVLIGSAQANNIPLLDLLADQQAAISAGRDIFRPGDVIHPNEAGQKLIADAILPVLESLILSPAKKNFDEVKENETQALPVNNE